MNQCATLVIEVDQNIDFNNYVFGISQPNGNVPYFWGGELSVVGGVSRWIFQGLVSGDYKWYVKNLSGIILMTGTKTVDCSLSDLESAIQSAIDSANSASLAQEKLEEVQSLVATGFVREVATIAEVQRGFNLVASYTDDNGETGQVLILKTSTGTQFIIPAL